MNLESKSGRPLRSLRRWCGALGVAALALLASCGGGTLENAFSPSRLVVFGDETSVLTTDSSTLAGVHYGVNYVDTSTGTAVPNCTLYPVWTQYLANALNLPFKACASTGQNAPSIMNAALGAKEADVEAQITAHLASDTLGEHDLVTIMVGGNDILEQYALYAAGSQDLATAQAVLKLRAQALSGQVDRVVALGGKVLISTVLNQGLTPYGAADGQRATDLTTLSSTYNNALRTALVNDSGRNVGLILADEIVRLDVVYPGSYSFTNATNAICPQATGTPADTASLLTCTSVTVGTSQPGADPAAWVWAGGTMLGPTPHRQIGDQAYSRATNNPF